jgi:hypothetical protein
VRYLVDKYILERADVVYRYGKVHALLKRCLEVRKACSWHPRSTRDEGARIRMAVKAFINHFCTYVFTGVVHAGYDLFCERSEGRGFAEVVEVHEVFLGDLYYETLVSEKTVFVMDKVEDMFGICMRVSELSLVGAEGGFEGLWVRFCDGRGFLSGVLNGMASQGESKRE